MSRKHDHARIPHALAINYSASDIEYDSHGLNVKLHEWHCTMHEVRHPCSVHSVIKLLCPCIALKI